MQHVLRMEEIQHHAVKILLERSHFVVSGIFCGICWTGITENNRTLH